MERKMARQRFFEEDYLRYGLSHDDDDDTAYGRGASLDKGSAKRGQPHTRGTAISFGFRRRAAVSAIPVPVAAGNAYQEAAQQQRSKSVGPEPEWRRRQQADDDCCAPGSRRQQYSSSGRSTPRLAPPKKEASGLPVRVNRFGFRNQQQARLTADKAQAQDAFHAESRARQPAHVAGQVSRYTLHSGSLPQPQHAVVTSSKMAKTAANQSRKVGGRAAAAGCSSKEGSGTEDSGLGSQHGGYSDDCRDARPQRPRRLGVLLSGKSFDVRELDDERRVVTEISVIPLPRHFAAAQQLSRASQSAGPHGTGLVRERASQYQRAILSKDNRYADSSTSMSTTSSEGYDEGLGEEKACRDRARSEKPPAAVAAPAAPAAPSAARRARFAAGSSDEQDEQDEQFAGHGGEAMADEFSLGSAEDLERRAGALPAVPCNTVTQTTVQHFKAISNAARCGALPNSTLRSVLLTIEDPAFAAVAATTTTLIDDETSPVDSLFDSPTASVSQAEAKLVKRKGSGPMESSSANTVDDDSADTPTNASNSLSLSEGREFFDDEIADQPGLVFHETLREASVANTTEHSQTVLESAPKITALQARSAENSPLHGRKMNRAGSVSTLSSCESLASDDLMMDYERSDASSFGDVSNRSNSKFLMKDLDEATSLLELEIQGQDVIRDWNSLLTRSQQSLTNSTNNNVSLGLNNNQNTESGLNSNNRATKLFNSRSSSESPRSLDSRRPQTFSPLRTQRNIQSPSIDSGDEGSLRMERGAYNYMFQDIVSIKTMLLKLKRVLQESEENGLTRSETLNPFDNTLKNALFYNLNDGNTTTDASLNDGREAAAAVADELADLRRQVVFLQGQVDDKDRTISSLRAQLTKYQNGTADLSLTTNSDDEATEKCNAATQTEKLRPVSTGPSILQSLSQDSNGMGSLISWNDSRSSQQSPSSQRYSGSVSDQSEQSFPHNNLSNGKITAPSSTSSSRRSSSDSSPQPAPRPNSLRGLKIPNGYSGSPPDSPKMRSAIPAPRSRLATPTLIPRATRAVSASGRAHNT
ncbi:serine-rich adhesin for platelets isoform X2 [Phymastichus coffea]|uniref:serine-rich adhesin for platelets isoform X2 n=1 Tax=Phymastichus coffea TaxID=108790 RepID=UPI00273BD30C|nr:serine-rich adhesin for platelets isoform X2 [Phymastichus coffea]